MAGVPGTRPPISSVRWRKLASSSEDFRVSWRICSVELSAANVVVASRTAEVSNERMKGRICGALEMKKVKSSKQLHAGFIERGITEVDAVVRLQWRHHEENNARLHNDDRDRCDGMQ